MPTVPKARATPKPERQWPWWTGDVVQLVELLRGYAASSPGLDAVQAVVWIEAIHADTHRATGPKRRLILAVLEAARIVREDSSTAVDARAVAIAGAWAPKTAPGDPEPPAEPETTAGTPAPSLDDSITGGLIAVLDEGAAAAAVEAGDVDPLIGKLREAAARQANGDCVRALQLLQALYDGPPSLGFALVRQTEDVLDAVRMVRGWPVAGGR